MASRGPFPLEIIQHIAHYLTHDWIDTDIGTRRWGLVPDGAYFASINEVWQEAIEREIFRDLRLDLERLAKADAILNGVPRRQKYVRTIQLEFVRAIMPLGLEQAAFGTPQDTEECNAILQDTFETFLSTLNHWTPGPPVKLYINLPQRDHRLFLEPFQLRHPEGVFSQGPVNVVTEFNICKRRSSMFDPEISAVAQCAMLAKLPEAKKVSIGRLGFLSNEPSRPRTEFATALTNFPHTIDQLHFVGESLPSPRMDANYKDSHPELSDKLSQTLGMMSQHLLSLELDEMTISDELFLQRDLHPHLQVASPAHWARLEKLRLNYMPLLPGDIFSLKPALFYPDPNVPDRDQAPLIADPAIQDRHLAAARAALEMPKLQNMTLVAFLDNNEWGAFFKFSYRRDANGRVAKAVWTNNIGWAPNQEVVTAWMEVPRKHLGTELEV